MQARSPLARATRAFEIPWRLEQATRRPGRSMRFRHFGDKVGQAAGPPTLHEGSGGGAVTRHGLGQPAPSRRPRRPSAFRAEDIFSEDKGGRDPGAVPFQTMRVASLSDGTASELRHGARSRCGPYSKSGGGGVGLPQDGGNVEGHV